MVVKGFHRKKPEMKVDIEGLEDSYFYFGPGMQDRWIESNNALLNYVGSKYGQSVRASLIAGSLIVTEVDEELLPKFNTADAEKKYLDSLAYWQQEEYKAAKEDYRKFSFDIRRDLSMVYETMYSMCHESVRGRLVADVDYHLMVSKRRYNSMTLYKLIRKICNGSMSVVSGDVLGNLMESLYTLLMVRGEDYESFPKYFEVVNHRYNILKESGFDLATDNLRDTLMVELSNRGQSESQMYKRLMGWKNASMDRSYAEVVKVGKESLMQAFMARVCVKRAGREFEEFRREVYNGYVAGSREYPADIMDANRLMTYYRPIHNVKRDTRRKGSSGEGVGGHVGGKGIRPNNSMAKASLNSRNVDRVDNINDGVTSNKSGTSSEYNISVGEFNPELDVVQDNGAPVDGITGVMTRDLRDDDMYRDNDNVENDDMHRDNDNVENGMAGNDNSTSIMSSNNTVGNGSCIRWDDSVHVDNSSGCRRGVEKITGVVINSNTANVPVGEPIGDSTIAVVSDSSNVYGGKPCTGVSIREDGSMFTGVANGVYSCYRSNVTDQLISTGVKCASSLVDGRDDKIGINQFHVQEEQSNDQDADPIGHNIGNREAEAIVFVDNHVSGWERRYPSGDGSMEHVSTVGIILDSSIPLGLCDKIGIDSDRYDGKMGDDLSCGYVTWSRKTINSNDRMASEEASFQYERWRLAYGIDVYVTPRVRKLELVPVTEPDALHIIDDREEYDAEDRDGPFEDDYAKDAEMTTTNTNGSNRGLHDAYNSERIYSVDREIMLISNDAIDQEGLCDDSDSIAHTYFQDIDGCSQCVTGARHKDIDDYQDSTFIVSVDLGGEPNFEHSAAFINDEDIGDHIRYSDTFYDDNCEVYSNLRYNVLSRCCYEDEKMLRGTNGTSSRIKVPEGNQAGNGFIEKLYSLMMLCAYWPMYLICQRSIRMIVTYYPGSRRNKGTMDINGSNDCSKDVDNTRGESCIVQEYDRHIMLILSDGMCAENRSIGDEQDRCLVMNSAIVVRYISCDDNNGDDIVDDDEYDDEMNDGEYNDVRRDIISRRCEELLNSGKDAAIQDIDISCTDNDGNDVSMPLPDIILADKNNLTDDSILLDVKNNSADSGENEGASNINRMVSNNNDNGDTSNDEYEFSWCRMWHRRALIWYRCCRSTRLDIPVLGFVEKVPYAWWNIDILFCSSVD